MRRYDDRYSSTRLYVGHLSSRTRSRDLDRLFSRYGRVRDVDMKYDYAFVDFSDPRDADDARYRLDGREFDGSRLIVEFARGTPRGSRDYGGRGSREYVGRGPPPGSGRCFNCGIDGHWARDCKAGDWKNKCYRCGERGHIEKNCPDSPRKTRPRSYSRSPRRSRSRSPSYSRSPSNSRSRSPSLRRERITEHEKKRSRSESISRSPSPRSEEKITERGEERSRSESKSPEPKRAGSVTSGNSPLPVKSPASERNSPSPEREKTGQNGTENESPQRDDAVNQSPYEANDGPVNGNCASPCENGVVEEDDEKRSPGETFSAQLLKKKSGREMVNAKNLAETFKSQGNETMQSKKYSDAIELYTYAIVLCEDNNAVYYCNRQLLIPRSTNMKKQSETLKSIEIDPNYALQLDPNNDSVKENIRVSEQKLREQERDMHDQGTTFTFIEPEVREDGSARISLGDLMPGDGASTSVTQFFLRTPNRANNQDDNANGGSPPS